MRKMFLYWVCTSCEDGYDDSPTIGTSFKNEALATLAFLRLVQVSAK
jgi:hypothetical protein